MRRPILGGATSQGEPAVSAEDLIGFLSYSPKTGDFVWTKKAARKTRIGGRAGYPCSNGYLRVNFRKKTYLLHRLAWQIAYGSHPESEIDHINGNRADNRIENLRLASCSENRCNTRMRSDNSSGTKGVHWDKRRKLWHASIAKNGARYFVGYFNDIDAASAAIKDARLLIHGEFANSGSKE